MEFYVCRGNSGYLRHAVVNGVALCGYSPEGRTAMGRGRARWNRLGDALQNAASISCEKCKARLTKTQNEESVD